MKDVGGEKREKCKYCTRTIMVRELSGEEVSLNTDYKPHDCVGTAQEWWENLSEADKENIYYQTLVDEYKNHVNELLNKVKK